MVDKAGCDCSFVKRTMPRTLKHYGADLACIDVRQANVLSIVNILGGS